MEKEKQETEELTLDEVCWKLNLYSDPLNLYSDPAVLYAIDDRAGSSAPPVILKIVRDHKRLRIWVLTDTLTELEAREELTEMSRVRM